MSALAGLVDKGLVAPDWAEALAPVDDRIAAMGRFLRDELAAGRPYLPDGRPDLRAPSSGRSPTSECSSSGRTRTRRPGTRSGCRFAVDAHVRPLPREPARTSTTSCATDVGDRARRRTAT